MKIEKLSTARFSPSFAYVGRGENCVVVGVFFLFQDFTKEKNVKKTGIIFMAFVLSVLWVNLADAIETKKSVKDAVRTVFYQGTFPQTAGEAELTLEDPDEPSSLTHYIRVRIPELNNFNAASANLMARASWDDVDFMSIHSDYIQFDIKNHDVYLPYAHSETVYPEGHPNRFWTFFSGKFTLKLEVYK